VNWSAGANFDTGFTVKETMDTVVSFLYIIVGLLLRLAIPILGTLLLVFFLRKLDAGWQAEAERHNQAMEKSECWKINGLATQQTENTKADESSLPCWQANRLPNGYLRDECLSCQVFTEAPVPTLKPESRSL
jgi:hypothetical protein